MGPISVGNAEWESGPLDKFLRVFLKAPDILAKEIYQWATDNLLLGTMATIYELYAGEDKDTGAAYCPWLIAFVCFPKKIYIVSIIF